METKNESKANITAKPEERSDEQIPAVIGMFDGLEKLITADIIVEALQDSWNDFCEDTDCFPNCFSIEREKGKNILYADFRKGNFSDSVTGQIIYLINKKMNNTPSNCT